MNRLSVDFHTHILPGVDDGSSSVNESLTMIKAEQKSGISRIVATPHFYADLDTADDFFSRRAQAAANLSAAVSSIDNKPEIILGAEVLYFDGIEHWDILPQLAIQGTKYILIEFSCTPFSHKMIKTLSNFKRKTGYTPIVAHLDRYITAFKTYNLPETLSELDVLVQMNASFFTKFPNSLRAINLLKKGVVHLLGSDTHNTTTRPPNIGIAQDIILNKIGQDAISRLIEYENLILGS